MRPEDTAVHRTMRRRMASTARDASGLLAPMLRRHAEAEGLSWEGLARPLGTSVQSLDRIAACRPPRPAAFAEDVEAIAAYAGADPVRLLDLLRVLETVKKFAEDAAATANAPRPYTMAARDREDPPEAGNG